MPAAMPNPAKSRNAAGRAVPDRRTGAALRRRAGRIVAGLRRARPTARVELDHTDPWQLLVATILSAQSTDARVNLVTPALFRACPDPAALARAPRSAVEAMIHSTGFFRSKAKSLQGCALALLERHAGRVPRSMDALVRLPGVGRKTANVVLAAGYGIAAGIVVDTHMSRLARRLGLTRQDDPVAIERDLLALVPEKDRVFFSIAGVLHGRHVCQARRPRCAVCPVARDCPSRADPADPVRPLRSGRVPASRRPGPGRGRDRS
jgi:endonuclease-3